jgi:hypothetical protein
MRALPIASAARLSEKAGEPDGIGLKLPAAVEFGRNGDEVTGGRRGGIDLRREAGARVMVAP